ncbi:3-oxoacyl-acyl-carrier-protein reductase [Aphelenchoides avenae]|nr:3-oxoacyl-acyl-carrier-protein reductase [Aphelenchus avenae]
MNVITLTDLAVPYLEKSRGNVVNVSSIGSKMGSSFMVYYYMSKAALEHSSMDAAVKYAPKGIRVNTIR